MRAFLIAALLIACAAMSGFTLGLYAAQRTLPLPSDCREIPVSTEPVNDPAVRAL